MNFKTFFRDPAAGDKFKIVFPLVGGRNKWHNILKGYNCIGVTTTVVLMLR